MSTQELFDGAQERYRYARHLVDEMIDFVKKDHPNFNEKEAIDQFDIIVQFILLKIALADGKFLEIEGEFIDQITDNYDVLFLFDSVDDTEYNWSFVGAYMGLSHVHFLVNKVEKRANEHIRAFIDLFAEVDLKDTSKTYIDELLKCIRDIALAFILCDGNGTDREVEIAVNSVREYLTEPWLANQYKLKNQF